MECKLSRQPVTDRNDPVWKTLMGVCRTLHPVGSKIEDMPIRNKVGILILARAIAHLTDDDGLRLAMALYCAEVGTSAGLRIPQESSIELIHQIGN